MTLVAAKPQRAKVAIGVSAMRKLLASVLALALPAFTSPASADVAGRYEAKGKDALIDMEMTIETTDAGDVRAQMAGQSNYFLLKDGVLYTVGRAGDAPVVERVADMLAVQSETLQRMGASRLMQEAQSKAPHMEFVKMGPESVGPWKGDGFGVKSGTGGAGPYVAFVMSDDPRIAPLGKGIAAMNSDITGRAGSLMPGFGMLGQEFLKFLSNGTPIRMLNIELTDVSYDRISPDRFELPAAPLTLEQVKAQAQPFPEPPTLPPRAKQAATADAR